MLCSPSFWMMFPAQLDSVNIVLTMNKTVSNINDKISLFFAIFAKKYNLVSLG